MKEQKELRKTGMRYRVDEGDAWVIVEIKLVHRDRVKEAVWQLSVDGMQIDNFYDHDDAVHEGRVLAMDLVALKSKMKKLGDKYSIEINKMNDARLDMLKPRRSEIELELGVIAQVQEPAGGITEEEHALLTTQIRDCE